MRVLITGATGFTGRALVGHLKDSGIRDVVGLARSVPADSCSKSGLRFVACDLLDRPRIHSVMADISPDCIIHLAGLTRGTPDDLFASNVTGTQNLLDAVEKTNPACRTVVVSSSAVYGYAGQDPIGEETPLNPVADYGASKVAQEEIVLDHHVRSGVQVAIARPFNLVGPGQPDTFLCGQIVKQAVGIERGEREHFELLETRSYRDFIDVRDAVRAYGALGSHPDFERACAGRVFNVGSGKPSAVSDVISLIEEITSRTYVVDLPEDPPVIMVPFQQADITRITGVTGWRPGISLKESLADMLESARKNDQS